MKCCNCNGNIEGDAVFCPECGAKQEKPFFCSECGTKLEPGERFCPECGNRTEEDMGKTIPSASSETAAEPLGVPTAPPAPRPKGKGGRIVAVVILAALIVLAVGGFFVFKALNGGNKPKDVYVEQENKQADKEKTKEKTGEVTKKETDVTKADIVAVGGEACSLEGNIKTDSSGKKVITWDDEVSISGLDENGKAVLAEEVTDVYINDIGLEEGVLDTVASNKKIVLGGQIYFIGDSIYIKANKITDDAGNVIENNKDKNSQAVRQTISYDYIIPYSATVLLGQGDIAGLSLQEINYAKNEIYARHGRKFKSNELQSYFNSKSWYAGTIEPDAFTDSMLSEVEKKNVTYLSDVEFSINPAGYQLDAR